MSEWGRQWNSFWFLGLSVTFSVTQRVGLVQLDVSAEFISSSSSPRLCYLPRRGKRWWKCHPLVETKVITLSRSCLCIKRRGRGHCRASWPSDPLGHVLNTSKRSGEGTVKPWRNNQWWGRESSSVISSSSLWLHCYCLERFSARGFHKRQ